MWRATPALVKASGVTSMPTFTAESVWQSALVAREDGLAAGAPREPGRVGEASVTNLRAGLDRPLAPTLESRDRERQLRVAPPDLGERRGERGKVLPRLEGADGQHVGLAEIRPVAVGPKARVDPRVRHDDPLLGNLQELDDLAPRERRVDEDAVARLRRVHVLRT